MISHIFNLYILKIKNNFKSKIKKIIENNINKIDIFRYIYIKNNLITLKMIRRKIFK